MNQILNSLKLDWYILKTNTRVVLIALLIAVIYGVSSPNSPYIIGIVAMFSSFSLGGLFAIAEKNNIDKLLGTLPVRKEQTVLGRFMLALLYVIANMTMALCVFFIVHYLRGGIINSFELLAWISGSFLFSSFAIALQFPIYFKWSFSKMQGLAILPFVALILIFSLIAKKDPQIFAQFIQFFNQYHYTVWLFGILGGLTLLVISIFVTIPIYKSKEL